MSATLSLGAEQVTWHPAANPWLIAVTVSLAAFMEVPRIRSDTLTRLIGPAA